MSTEEKIGPEELRRRAAKTLNQSGLSQAEIAEELGRSRSSISRAINETGTKFARLQCEVIELLTPYTVTEERLYILKEEKDSDDLQDRNI